MRSLFVVAVTALAAACSNPPCGEGQVAKYNPTTGATDCVPAVATGVQCDPATTVKMGDVCVGDPTKFPSCGPGTMLDPTSNQCVPSGMNVITPKPCDATQMTGRFCINGVVRFLKDDSYTKGTTLEVRAYDPIAFLGDPVNTQPQQTVMTDANGTYVMNNLMDTSGMGIIAIAVTDVGGPKTYILSGSGAQNLTAGGKYEVDLFAVEKSLVATWDTEAGLMGSNTFEANGAYLGIYQDQPLDMEQMGMRIPGVQLVAGGAVSTTDTFYFKGDFMTIDKSLTATDAMTGAVIQKTTPGALNQYSGMCASGQTCSNIMWETVLGASTTGVVFIQWFHPKTM